MGLLYQEFWLYAARNPAAREELMRIEDEGVRALAEIIEAERERQGIEPLESAVQAARLIEILFRGIGQLQSSNPMSPMTISSRRPFPSWHAGSVLPSTDGGLASAPLGLSGLLRLLMRPLRTSDDPQRFGR